MRIFAEVAVYQSGTRRTFHYGVPPALPIQVGQLVEVSFRTGLSQGIVLHLTSESPVPHTKPINQIILPEPVVTPLQIALAREMAEYTVSSVAACLWLSLPPGLAKKGSTCYQLLDKSLQLSEDTLAGQVVALLRERGPLRAAQIDHALPNRSWKEALKPLLAEGKLKAEAVLPEPEAQIKTVRAARLLISSAEARALADQLAKRSPKQSAVLRYLAEAENLVETAHLNNDISDSNDSLKRLADKGYLILEEIEKVRDPLAASNYGNFPLRQAPTLTEDQRAVWETIRAAQEADGGAFLLHGVTGSGKTEIYLHAIEFALRQKRQAIVLVPEIALVAQTVSRFVSRFPDQVAVMHSALSDGEQYDAWRRAKDGQISIVIGARSALFTPLPDVGVVILDEEHDDSYKQSPPLPPPYYHAREVAESMMRLNRGVLILGSATPDVTTTYRARHGEIGYLHLPDRVIMPQNATDGAPRAVAAVLPQVDVVDMREELRHGNRSMFSTALRDGLQATLDRGEQAILFLNRRGAATFVLCRDCGYVSKCPNCDLPLTYHKVGDAGQLMCHYCGHRAQPPHQCPECRSGRIRYFGAGTASVAEAVETEFTGAKVLRWDRDTVAKLGGHEAIWIKFARGEANILVGTQMVVKGLDLPRVTLVGVMLAEIALGLPDYRAGERTFQLLTQAAGRAGRSWRGGRVVFQSYKPENYAIQAAAGHDFEAFYTREIAYRQMLAYPPFKHLVRVIFSDSNAAKAEREAKAAAAILAERIVAENLTATQLIGPAPAHFGRINSAFYWHIIARTSDPSRLIGDPPKTWVVDVNPTDIL